MNNDQKKQAYSSLMQSRASKFKADVDSGKYLLPQELGEKAPYFNQSVEMQIGDTVKGKEGTGYPTIIVDQIEKDKCNGVVLIAGKGTRWYRQEDFEHVA
jgi:hypothetical protein